MNTNYLFNMLINYALDHGIGLKMEPSSKTLQCVSIPPANTIYVNTNYMNSNQLPFQLAHEIGHLVTEKDTTLYKKDNKVFRLKAERNANVKGLKIIIPMFLSLTEYSVNSIYPLMDQLQIPNKLCNEVSDVMCDELKKLTN